ncbi:MAG: hypothetical protein NPIRA01_29580 [Nitrospirales bacterium]|nr:MAG: hypothetical protein NPIRA01_29580 [Nitrospirales bacterium]
MTIKHPTLNHSSRGIQCCILAFFMTSMVGCNPEEAIQQYFAEQGLNPIAILRTDVEPGTLILVRKTGEARLVDQLTNFMPTDTRSPAHLPIQNCGTEQGCPGILRGHQESRTTTASAAVSFFHSLFRVQPALELELSEQMSIQQLDSRYKKIGIGDLELFLRTRAAKPVYRRILDSLNDGEQAFVAYEVHSATQLHIAAANGHDIAPSLKVDTIEQIPIGGKAGLQLMKTSKETLSVASDQAYVFAVKTAEIVKGDVRGTIKLKVTQPLPISAGDIKGPPATTSTNDDSYASPIHRDFAAVRFEE